MKAQDKLSSRQQPTHENLAGEVSLDVSISSDIVANRISEWQAEPRSNPMYHDKNCWTRIGDQYMLSPIYGGLGRVLVQQDNFKSRFDCTECGGKGHTNEPCQYCLGTKWDKGKEENGECRDCTVGTSDGRVTYGKTLCPVCHGKQGTIIIPDDAKSDTTMGTVVAVSYTNIEITKPGDKVMYSSYYGTKFIFEGILFRIGTEKDLFCLVKQLKQNVDSVKEQGFADLENTGVPHD